MTLGQEQELFARHFVDLLRLAMSKGYGCRLGEVQRPVEMQEIYVKTGRSKTMNSNHLRKCAGDVFFTENGVILTGPKLKVLGDFWESLDPKNSWGGNWKSFKDEPHFERRP